MSFDRYFTRFSVKDQTLFAKRMSFLVKAGVPIIDALLLIRTQTRSRSKARVFDAVIDDVNNGKYLAVSMERHKHLFGEFTINLIRAGEKSGILSQNLAYIAEELQKKDELRRKVLGALVYPFIITFATFGITGVLMLYVFPKILPVFKSLHITLPLSTRVLIAVSGFLTVYGGWLLLGLSCLSVLLILVYKKYLICKSVFDHFILKLPVFGKMIRSYHLANFTRTLGLFLKSGVELTDALSLCSQTTTNLAYQRGIKSVEVSVTKGEPMSREIGLHTRLFPDMLPSMVAVGESTGNLSGMLIYLSEMYESDIEVLTKNLSSAIEPTLMVMMGVMVGFIAISIITPIYEITQNLH